MSRDEDHDPLDIFSSSLETLYDHQPVTIASAGSTFADDYQRVDGEKLSVELQIPDTEVANWFLHASDIWASARHLANNIPLLHLEDAAAALGSSKLRLLELGASAGLPGILLAKLYPDILITVSGYPDELLIDTLSRNVQVNGVEKSCRVVPYAWGSDPAPLLGADNVKFDVIIAADTLWSSTTHPLFIQTLQATLNKTSTARVHLVAGLHTGRYTIQSYIYGVVEAGFNVESATEMQIKGTDCRPWDVNYPSEGETQERRRWVVWIVLKWGTGVA